MTIRKILLLTIFASSLLFLSNCKKDLKPADPCEGKSLPKADFMLAEKLSGENRYFETDKIIYVLDLFLRGPDGYDEYLWQVGTNPKWSTKKNAKVGFTQPEGLLKVRLIAKRKPFTECFPNDDGIDTMEKTVDIINGIINNNVNSVLIGYWEGTSTQYGDTTYTVRFYAIDSSGWGQQDGYLDAYLYNLTRAGCSSTNSDFVNYIHWTGETASSKCKDHYTYLAYTNPANKDNVTIEYRVVGPAPDYKWANYVFTGKRK